ncbi:MAG: hypothetical protein LRY27_04725, partial [Chitinophagales bacterium]|nr:hypothetical protein [Chitinophagales bacterium]
YVNYNYFNSLKNDETNIRDLILSLTYSIFFLTLAWIDYIPILLILIGIDFIFKMVLFVIVKVNKNRV